MEHSGDESRGRGGPSRAMVRNAMLVMLSLAAGCVDAVGFLGLGQIFVANMTGNTVLLGLALGQAKGQAALRAVVALAGFVAGVGAGAAIFGRDQEGSSWSPAGRQASRWPSRPSWSYSSHLRSVGSPAGPNRKVGRCIPLSYCRRWRWAYRVPP
jgi:hypothetical protein